MVSSRMFSGCAGLKEAKFEGTTEQWSAIDKTWNWCAGADFETVYCIASDEYVDATGPWSAFGTICGSELDRDFDLIRLDSTTWEMEALELKAGEYFYVRWGHSSSFHYGLNEEAGGDTIRVEEDGKYIIRMEIHGEQASVDLVPIP